MSPHPGTDRVQWISCLTLTPKDQGHAPKRGQSPKSKMILTNGQTKIKYETVQVTVSRQNSLASVMTKRVVTI